MSDNALCKPVYLYGGIVVLVGGIMNYNSDKPIESSEQDLLGRTTFSKQLGEAIYKYDGKDGLVLGFSLELYR